MSDEQTETTTDEGTEPATGDETPSEAAETEQPGADETPSGDGTEQTDAPEDEPTAEELEARVVDLEEQLAAATARAEELEARVVDLEADPYRTPAVQGATQFDLATVAQHEDMNWQAQVNRWEAETGRKHHTEDELPDKVTV